MRQLILDFTRDVNEGNGSKVPLPNDLEIKLAFNQIVKRQCQWFSKRGYPDDLSDMRWLYLIKCMTTGLYYIGETINLGMRVSVHSIGNGSIFLFTHGVQSVLDCLSIPGQWKAATLEEVVRDDLVIRFPSIAVANGRYRDSKGLSDYETTLRDDGAEYASVFRRLRRQVEQKLQRKND